MKAALPSSLSTKSITQIKIVFFFIVPNLTRIFRSYPHNPFTKGLKIQQQNNIINITAYVWGKEFTQDLGFVHQSDLLVQ